MAKMNPKTFSWDDPKVTTEGITSFNFYYQEGAAGSVNYNSPKISVPVVAGQLTGYSIVTPTLPLVAGKQYEIGVSAVNAMGESDIAVFMPDPFVFAAPTAPTNLKVT